MFCKLTIGASGKTYEMESNPEDFTNSELIKMIQIDHPELLIGPVEGFRANNYILHSKSYRFSRVTTYNS